MAAIHGAVLWGGLHCFTTMKNAPYKNCPTFTLLLLSLACSLSGIAMVAHAQTHEIYLPAPSKPMTVQDVIKLSKAGLGDDLIIQQLEKKNQRFDLSTDQLLQLKTAAVSDRVIQVMIDPTLKPIPAAVAPAVVPAPTPAKAAAAPETQEIGVYAKVKGAWSEVLPEVVNWKSGGVMKNVATVGIVKEDLNGHVNGPTSRNRVTNPVEFQIVVPDGIAITEYQLLRLHQHGSNREFRTVTGGVFHVSGGATRDLLPFDGTKIAARQYTVTLPVLAAGEYGFLPPYPATANAASSGKIYSFRIIE
jgi:hypothetical protein